MAEQTIILLDDNYESTNSNSFKHWDNVNVRLDSSIANGTHRDSLESVFLVKGPRAGQREIGFVIDNHITTLQGLKAAVLSGGHVLLTVGSRSIAIGLKSGWSFRNNGNSNRSYTRAIHSTLDGSLPAQWDAIFGSLSITDGAPGHDVSAFKISDQAPPEPPAPASKLRMGSATATRLYVGGTQASRAYLGTERVL